MVLRGEKSKLTNLRFLYSQDLSNCTIISLSIESWLPFLYSQDLSNCTIPYRILRNAAEFLYSQDLSNCTIKRGHI